MRPICNASENDLHRRAFCWNSSKLLALVLCVGSLGMMVNRQWQGLEPSDRYLGASLVSGSMADYSQRRPSEPIAQVDLKIVRDMIRDSQPLPGQLPARLASVDMLLNNPPHSAASSSGHPDSESGAKKSNRKSPLANKQQADRSGDGHFSPPARTSDSRRAAKSDHKAGKGRASRSEPDLITWVQKSI